MISSKDVYFYLKWLRYYLDFCDKYSHTIYGKGRKFRKVLLPKKIIYELKGHLERVKNLHKRDLKEGYNGVFMPSLIEKNIRIVQ